MKKQLNVMGHSYLCAAIGGGALLCGAAAWAQVSGAEEGNLKTLSFISSLQANDNYDLRADSLGNALIWTNTLAYRQQYATEIDSFNASASGDLRFADLPVVGTENSLDNGTVNVRYAREIDDSSFGFRVFYNNAELAYLDPLDYIDESDGLEDDDGTGRRQLLNGDFDLSLHEDGPLSFQFTGAYKSRSYYDTDDSDDEDRTDINLLAETGMELKEGYRALFGATYKVTDEEDSFDSERYEVYTGLRGALSPTQSFTARIGYSQSDTTRNSGDDGDYDGAVAQFSYDEDMRNGTFNLAFSSRLYETGRRNQISVGRDLALPAGALSASLGVANSDAFEIRPFGSLSYTTRGPTSQFTLGFSQNFNVDDDGNDVINSSLNAAYDYQVNAVSSFGLKAGAASRIELDDDATENDLVQVTLSASYNYALTRDWRISSGLTHRAKFEENDPDAFSNALFVTLTRSFTTR